MKPTLFLFALWALLSLCAPQSFAEPPSAADAKWDAYLQSLKAAVTAHDSRALKGLVASQVQYEDGKVADKVFIEDLKTEADRLLKALNSGTVSGKGSKRTLTSDSAEIGFIFAKGKWYLRLYSVGG